MTRIRIRRAAPRDLERVREVEVASYATPWSAATFRSLLARKDVLFLVAEVAREGAGKVIGHGVLWRASGEAELANLAVVPRARERGIGGALLDRLLSSAAGSGVSSVFLEVRESNQAARALYGSRGFHQVGVRRQYYDQPREDALILRLDLASGSARSVDERRQGFQRSRGSPRPEAADD